MTNDEALFVRASELIRETSHKTGFYALDSALHGVELGHTYLFYGFDLLNEVVNRIIVNVAKLGKVLFLLCEDDRFLVPLECNNTASSFREVTKSKALSEKVSFASISNYFEGTSSVKELITRFQNETQLVILYNIATILNSDDRKISTRRVNGVVSALWQLCSKKKMIFLMTTMPKNCSTSEIPHPDATAFIMHIARTIIFFERKSNKAFATIMKHPSLMTPLRLILE